jgi:hypothetical protein
LGEITFAAYGAHVSVEINAMLFAYLHDTPLQKTGLFILSEQN